MGNQVLKDHNVGKQVASGGPGGIWKIYDATRKSNGQQVSLFVFEKKVLEKFPKNVQKSLIDSLKKDGTALARIRHPRVLHILQPLLESATAVVMETEPVFASLENAVLKNYANLPTPPTELSQFEIDDMELRVGFYELTEALNFVHNQAKLIHLNLTPECIFISKSGEWKLGGFNFSSFSNYSQTNEIMFDYEEVGNKTSLQLRPSLDYLAPEYIFLKRFDFHSDFFSLGVVIYNLYNPGKKLLDNGGSILSYRPAVEKLHPINMGNVPRSLQGALQRLLALDPEKRLDPEGFLASDYFADVLVRSVIYLGNIIEKEDSNKIQFLKGLVQALPRFQPRIVRQRILSVILSELKNQGLVPFILPCVFAIADTMDKADFSNLILPSLFPIMDSRESLHGLLMLLHKLETLVSKSPQTAITNHILPMFYAAFEVNRVDIIQTVLKQTPVVAHLIEYTTLKSSILPRVQVILLGAALDSIRVNALTCYTKLIPILDKEVVTTNVLPVLNSMIESNLSAEVLMGLLAAYEAIAHNFGDEISALFIVPKLSPLLLNKELDRPQFTAIMKAIMDILLRIEKSRQAVFDEREKQENAAKSKAAPEQWNNFQNLVSSDVKKTATVQSPRASRNNQLPPTAEQTQEFQDLLQREKQVVEPLFELSDALNNSTTKKPEKEVTPPTLPPSEIAFNLDWLQPSTNSNAPETIRSEPVQPESGMQPLTQVQPSSTSQFPQYQPQQAKPTFTAAALQLQPLQVTQPKAVQQPTQPVQSNILQPAPQQPLVQSPPQQSLLQSPPLQQSLMHPQQQKQPLQTQMQPQISQPYSQPLQQSYAQTAFPQSKPPLQPQLQPMVYQQQQPQSQHIPLTQSLPQSQNGIRTQQHFMNSLPSQGSGNLPVQPLANPWPSNNAGNFDDLLSSQYTNAVYGLNNNANQYPQPTTSRPPTSQQQNLDLDFFN